MDEPTYSESQIKAAFRDQFYGAGELWFPYTPYFPEEEAEDAWQSQWEEFLEVLKSKPEGGSNQK